jgi:hypothetical protein
MSTDAGDLVPRPAVDIWTLPDILGVRARRLRLRVPREYVPWRKTVDDIAEVELHLDGDVPARALSPVAFVGATTLTEFEWVEPGVYRFWAPWSDDDGGVAAGAPVSIGWSGELPPGDDGGKGDARHRIESIEEEEGDAQAT